LLGRKLGSEVFLTVAGQIRLMAEILVIGEEVPEEWDRIFLEILDCDVLWNKTSQRVDDGAVANFLVKLAVLGVPLV
jgi:hypothetical protein